MLLFSELQICTPSCWLNVPTWKGHSQVPQILLTHNWINFPHLTPKPVSFSSVSYFNEQHIYPTAQARNLTLFSPLLLTSSQIPSNIPLHFSNLLSPPHPVTIWAQTCIISHLVYHSVSSPASLLGSHNYLSVDATQVRPFPCLKSFNDSPYGGRGKMKCKDLIVELAYLSSLIFCMPILKLLPPKITVHYIQFSRAQPVPHSFISWFINICSCQFSAGNTNSSPQPLYLANSYSSLKAHQAFPIPHDWIKYPSNQPSKHLVLFLPEHLSDYILSVCLMSNISSIWCSALPLVRVGKIVF